MPVVDSIEELNALLEAADDADDRRRIGNRVMSVGHDWAIERELLLLPSEPFDTALTLTPRVDRYAQVVVRTLSNTACRRGSLGTGCGSSCRPRRSSSLTVT